MTLPLDRFMNVIEWWASQRVKDYDQFQRKLNEPPKGERSDQVRQKEADDFTAFAAAFGVTPPQPEPADA